MRARILTNGSDFIAQISPLPFIWMEASYKAFPMECQMGYMDLDVKNPTKELLIKGLREYYGKSIKIIPAPWRIC